MLTVNELIRNESDGSISFGDYSLSEKSKLSDFEHAGDLYKVKTFYEITKLERNGAFVYESVPGTSVFNMTTAADEIGFEVTGKEAAQITLELESEATYEVFVGSECIGAMQTNLGGKLMFSVDLSEDRATAVRVKRI